MTFTVTRERAALGAARSGSARSRSRPPLARDARRTGPAGPAADREKAPRDHGSSRRCSFRPCRAQIPIVSNSGLRVVPGSVVSRPTPESDILCELAEARRSPSNLFDSSPTPRTCPPSPSASTSLASTAAAGSSSPSYRRRASPSCLASSPSPPTSRGATRSWLPGLNHSSRASHSSSSPSRSPVPWRSASLIATPRG